MTLLHTRAAHVAADPAEDYRLRTRPTEFEIVVVPDVFTRPERRLEAVTTLRRSDWVSSGAGAAVDAALAQLELAAALDDDRAFQASWEDLIDAGDSAAVWITCTPGS